MSLLDHAGTLLSANTPPGGLVLNLGDVRVVLARRSLESLLLFKSQIRALLGSNLPSCIFLGGRTGIWAVVAGARFEDLLLGVRCPLKLVSHRELRSLVTSECLSHVLSGSWHFHGQFRFVHSFLTAKAESGGRSLHL